MQGRYGRYKSFTPTVPQPTGVDWLGKLKGLLEMRFEDATTDATLADCISAAIEHVEECTGRVIRVGTMRVEYEAWSGRFGLPFLPFVSGLTVKKWDGTTDIAYTKEGNNLTIDAPNGCVITYQAGYGASCPPLLQMAILKTALTMYEIRSNVAVGTISNNIPQNADELMEAFVNNQDS